VRACDICHSTTLHSLWLGGNQLGPACGSIIGVALQRNASLTQLDLGDNALGDEGASALADRLASPRPAPPHTPPPQSEEGVPPLPPSQETSPRGLRQQPQCEKLMSV
jgi:hypothetical protein